MSSPWQVNHDLIRTREAELNRAARAAIHQHEWDRLHNRDTLGYRIRTALAALTSRLAPHLPWSGSRSIEPGSTVADLRTADRIMRPREPVLMVFAEPPVDEMHRDGIPRDRSTYRRS